MMLTPGSTANKARTNRVHRVTIWRMKKRLAAQGDLRASHYHGHGTNLVYTLPAELLMVTLYLALPSLALVECMRLIGALTGEHASKSSHSRARKRQGLSSKKIQYWSGNQAS